MVTSTVQGVSFSLVNLWYRRNVAAQALNGILIIVLTCSKNNTAAEMHTLTVYQAEQNYDGPISILVKAFWWLIELPL